MVSPDLRWDPVLSRPFEEEIEDGLTSIIVGRPETSDEARIAVHEAVDNYSVSDESYESSIRAIVNQGSKERPYHVGHHGAIVRLVQAHYILFSEL